MGKVTIELNEAGVRELLKSKEIAEACREQAEAVHKVVGKGFEVESRRYPERTGYVVTAGTEEAKKAVLKDNVLLKAMGAV